MYLSTTSSVLGSTSGKVLGVILGGEIVVEEPVFFLGENCVVRLEFVFIEKFLVSAVGRLVKKKQIIVGTEAC